MKYYCHIYGDIGHKIIDCLKYNGTYNMFKNKNEDYKETRCGRAQGCKSISSYNGCQHGYH
jgi:hypothetical protein